MSAAMSPPATNISSAVRARMLLVERRRNLDLAALVVFTSCGTTRRGSRSVLSGLLIVYFAADDLIEILPGIVANQPAAVQKESRRGVHMQRASFRYGCVHFAFGRLGVDATAELQAVEIRCSLGEIQDLRLQVVDRDVVLLVVNPIVKLPELVRALVKDASAGDRRRLGPRVDLLQRKILEDHAHLGGKLPGYVFAQRFRFLFAIGTLEIAEFDECDARGGWAEAGSSAGLQCVEIVLERILGEVVHHAANDLLAVLGDK